MPSTNYVWESKQNNKPINVTDVNEFFCHMEKSNVCVKYTYIYNSAVVNVSYFCGKVIEDQTTAITAGCFVQYTEGYTIEVCACRSRDGSMPCNSTIRNTYSMLIIFIATSISLFMYTIYNTF
ncbi:uncharacterized protein LOC109858581 [Pseudomyrmex gracilis]|uniref:uncharacterized protein LOC109858581 n=1 Tax=Pseudomyrmex gracilis TaxID=219809 RepID=UPI00099598A4|nr:uncharacterized protein LOC109858581 [Pseudomyrmex gracilis]